MFWALTMQKAVFLDRDGVLNRVVFRDGRPGSPRCLEEFHLFDGVDTALQRLRNAGFHLVVVSNQPDVPRGLLDPDVLECMNQRLLARLPIQRVVVCVHDDHHECRCRKPKPGMLLDAVSRDGINLADSYMIGDSWKDIAAAFNARCKSILLRREYNSAVSADFGADSLAEAVDFILD